MSKPTTAAEAIKLSEDGCCKHITSGLVLRLDDEFLLWKYYDKSREVWCFAESPRIISSNLWLPCPDPSKPEQREPEPERLELHHWICDSCGTISDIEEEVSCWHCKEGQMIFHRYDPPHQVVRLLRFLKKLRSPKSSPAIDNQQSCELRNEDPAPTESERVEICEGLELSFDSSQDKGNQYWFAFKDGTGHSANFPIYDDPIARAWASRMFENPPKRGPVWKCCEKDRFDCRFLSEFVVRKKNSPDFNMIGYLNAERDWYVAVNNTTLNLSPLSDYEYTEIPE